MCTVLLPPGDNPIAGKKYVYLSNYIMTNDRMTVDNESDRM